MSKRRLSGRLCVDEEIRFWINALKYNLELSEVNQVLHLFKNLLLDHSWQIPEDAVDAVKQART